MGDTPPFDGHMTLLTTLPTSSGDEARPEEVGSVVRSRGCSACCARRVYWNVNYFSVIRAIAMTRAVVGHRERAVPVACWPSTIYGCSYELLIGLTTSLKTIDGDCW